MGADGLKVPAGPTSTDTEALCGDKLPAPCSICVIGSADFAWMEAQDRVAWRVGPKHVDMAGDWKLRFDRSSDLGACQCIAKMFMQHAKHECLELRNVCVGNHF